MHDKTGDWRETTDYIVYQEKNKKGEVGECVHCGKTFTNIKSLKYEHKMFCPLRYADKSKAKQVNISCFLNEKQKIQEERKIRKIVQFICETATPLNATQN